MGRKEAQSRNEMVPFSRPLTKQRKPLDEHD